jgi:hypothetical protein
MEQEKTTQEPEVTNAFDVFDDAITEWTGVPKEESSESENKDLEKPTEPEKSEPEKKEEPIKPEEVDDFDFSKVDLKGKWNGEEKPIVDMLKEAIKHIQANPEDVTAREIIANIQKSYDYSKKAEEIKSKVKEIEYAQKGVQNVLLENLSYIIGNPPLKAVFNPLNETNGEIKKDEKTGQEIIVYNDELSYTNHQNEEQQFGEKFNSYISTKKNVETENNVMGQEFAKAHPDIDFQNFVAETLPYLGFSASKGLVPFPKDTLELFYRGKNFDKLVKAREEQAVAKVYEELGHKQNKATPNIKSQKVTPKEEKEKLPDEKDFDDGIQDFVNGKSFN